MSSYSNENEEAIGRGDVFLKSHHWPNYTESDLSMYQNSLSSIMMVEIPLDNLPPNASELTHKMLE